MTAPIARSSTISQGGRSERRDAAGMPIDRDPRCRMAWPIRAGRLRPAAGNGDRRRPVRGTACASRAPSASGSGQRAQAPRLIDTAPRQGDRVFPLAGVHGQIVVIKLLLFTGIQALAAVNRLSLTPALLASSASAGGRLRRCIGCEVVLAAGIPIATAAPTTTVSAPPGDGVSDRVSSLESPPPAQADPRLGGLSGHPRRADAGAHRGHDRPPHPASRSDTRSNPAPRGPLERLRSNRGGGDRGTGSNAWSQSRSGLFRDVGSAACQVAPPCRFRAALPRRSCAQSSPV